MRTRFDANLYQKPENYIKKLFTETYTNKLYIEWLWFFLEFQDIQYS